MLSRPVQRPKNVRLMTGRESMAHLTHFCLPVE
jgi:hypothetical protein